MEKIFQIASSIPTPIALAGFGAACAFFVALAVIRGITRKQKTEDASLSREIVRTLYKMFVWTILSVVVVVVVVSGYNLFLPVQSNKPAEITTGATPQGEPTGSEPPIAPTNASPVPENKLFSDSGWVPGGQDPVSFCNRQLAGLQAQFPAVHIETVKRNEFSPQKHKNGLGIVTGVSYRYQCWFKTS